MELIDLLNESKSIGEIIKNLKNFLEKKFNSEIILIEPEKIRNLLDVKELKKLLIDKEEVIKEENFYIPLHDNEKIYTIIYLSPKDGLKIEELKRTLFTASIFIKNFRLFEDAKNEIFKLNFLFNFYRALETQAKENIENSLKELLYLLNLKGIYFKTKNFDLKIGSLENLEESKIKEIIPYFETQGESIIYEEKRIFSFSKIKTIFLIDKEVLNEEEKEFLNSIVNLSEEWYEEKLPFSSDFLEKVISLNFNESLKFVRSYLADKMDIYETQIFIKEEEKFKSIEDRAEFKEKEDINFFELKTSLGDYLISFRGEKKDINLTFLSLILDLLSLKKNFENLNKLNRVLMRIIDTIPYYQNIEEFLYNVGYIIKEELNILYVGFLLKEEEDYLRMKVGIGYENYEELSKRRLKIGVNGLSGHSVQRKEIIYAPDVSKDIRYIPASPFVKSEVILPLIVEKEAIGVIVVSSPKLDGFSMEDIEIFERISKLISSFLAYRNYIDGLKKELKSLKGEEEFIDIILKNIPIGIIYADRDLFIKRVNFASIYTLKLKEEEIIGSILCRIFEDHEPQDPNCIFRRSIEERIPLIKKNVEIKRGEESIPLSLSSTFIYEKERIKGFILMIEDIKEVVALEEQLRRTERLSAIGRIAAHMAHEIKNPLASISVGIEYIYASLQDDDPKKKHLGVILKEISRLDRLIKNLLSFARRPPLKRKRVNIKEMIEEILIFYSQEFREKKVDFYLSLSEYELIAYVDEDQMKEVLENLIRNAIESMPEGGKLTLQAGEKTGGIIFISIEDTGIGIEPSELAHIFEPFYTTKKGGSGLGLAIVHRIIEDHGAKIYVESEKGKGTKFLIEIPK